MASAIFTLSFLFHVVILLFSFSCACVAGLYVHPLLLPILAYSVPRFGSALRAQLTMPFLFILLNLLVGALYVTSRMMPQGSRGQQEDAETNMKMNEESSLAKWPKKVAAGDVLSDDAVPGAEMSNDVSGSEMSGDIAEMSHDILCSNILNGDDNNAVSGTEMSGDIVSGAERYDDAVSCAKMSCDFFGSNIVNGVDNKVERLEVQKRNAKNRSRRLARSKSDGIALLASARKSPMELRAVPPLLKKSGTFESAWRRRRVKPVIVVEDPPEDGQVAEEEVDKKAEDFIGKFYQKVKLQSLE